MSGSILKAWWNGVTYPVKATADLNQNPSGELEGIATSGDTLFKEEKQVETIENFEMIVTAEEEATLREDFKNKVKAAMGFKEEDGRIKDAFGRLKLGVYNTMESTLEVAMIPKGTWTITPA